MESQICLERIEDDRAWTADSIGPDRPWEFESPLRQYLDRHVTAQVGIFSPVHDTHAALADFF